MADVEDHVRIASKEMMTTLHQVERGQGATRDALLEVAPLQPRGGTLALAYACTCVCASTSAQARARSEIPVGRRSPWGDVPDLRLPLESGDHLTRYEFERRYEAMSEIKKAELVEGVVYMPSPVRVSHGESHALVITWLGTFCAVTPGVEVGDNTTVRLDPDNEVQPDAFLRLDRAQGGSSKISADEYLEGAPELVVEIAASSAAYDLHEKKRVYRRNGVQEYVVWQIYERRIDWFQLREGEYVRLTPDEAGVSRSHVFPGLYLDSGALLEGDLARVLAELQKGLATSEHAAFVERLYSYMQQA